MRPFSFFLVRRPHGDQASRMARRTRRAHGGLRGLGHARAVRDRPEEEHLRVRNAAGLFDIDHMGRLELTGPQAVELLQKRADLGRLPGRHRPGATTACSSMSPAASSTTFSSITGRRLMAHRRQRTPIPRRMSRGWSPMRSGFDVTLRDAGADTCMMALQGPAARAILQQLCPEDGPRQRSAFTTCGTAPLPALPPLSAPPATPASRATRSSSRPAVPCETWEALLGAGAGAGCPLAGWPRGFPARRGLPSPLRARAGSRRRLLSAGLARAAVCFTEGHDFIGRNSAGGARAGQAARAPGRLRDEDPGGAPHGYAIAHGGRPIGTVTTGLFSPSTGRYRHGVRGIGGTRRTGAESRIVIRDTGKAARIVERPFYTSPHWR